MKHGISEEVSRAIALDLGKGESSYPTWDPERSRRAGISDEAAKRAGEIIEDSLKVHVDWSTTSLSEAGYMVKQEMAARHPSLSPIAVDALAWNFTFIHR